MRAIDELETALARFNAEALNRLDDSAPGPMAKVAADIARRLSPRRALVGTASFDERQLEALRRFRERGEAPDFRTLRLACRGCTHYIAEDRFVLLADSAALDALLDAVERHAHKARRFRRLFDALRHAYLGVDREADWFKQEVGAKQGNEQLRQFLEDRLANVHRPEPAPEWVHTLASYPEVLSSDPGRRFASDLLAGSWQQLDAACRSLGITGASWVASEAVRSATAAVVGKDHQSFISHIPALLAIARVQRFEALRDEIYARLVTRYAEIPSHPVHVDLRDALVAAWKNPWLARNDSAWSRHDVTAEARTMVAGWLKLDLIHQFFDVLSDDRGQDRSRFEFWSRYYEQMDDVYVALGTSAFYSGSPDLVKLRRDLDGRLLKLNSTGADTNAFIMFMGNLVVVEFSQKGNAAYRYRRTDAPISDATRTVGISQLKCSPPGIRMLHMRDWQRQFSRELVHSADVRRGTAHPLLPAATQRPPAGPRAQTWLQQATAHHANSAPIACPRPTNNGAPPSPADVAAFAQRHSLNWANQRPKGGNLWVLAEQADSEITRQLKVWGFAYRPGKGWWRA